MIISKSAVFMRFSDCEPFHVSMMLGAGSGAVECSMVLIRELRQLILADSRVLLSLVERINTAFRVTMIL